MLATTTAAFAFGTGQEGCGADCASCHTVTKEEAKAVVSKLDPALTVDEVKPAPVRGLYEMVLKKENQIIGIAYLDFSKKYMIAGKIFDVGTRNDLTQATLDKVMVVDPKKITTEHAVVLGNPKGTKPIYVFSDPECPFCVKLHHELTQLVKEDPQVKVYILLNPLSIHPNAMWKSQSILCTSKKNMAASAKMLEDSYEKKEIKAISCDKNYAEETAKLARSLGLPTTPTMVFPNGRVVIGAKKKEEIKTILEQSLAKK